MNPLAVISGASRGIGKHAAYYFAAKGYDLVLIARDGDLLEAVSQDIENQFSIKSFSCAVDVSQYSEVKAHLEKILSQHATIEVLFNNAGILNKGTSELSPEDFNSMVDVNVRGVYNLSHIIAPKMKEQRSGYIFNLASYAGKRPLARSGAYCMTKYGVVGFSQSLSLELVDYNIKVTAICPSVVNTDMTRDFDIPDDDKITCRDLMQTLDYLLNLSPNAYVDEVIIKSTYLLKNN